MADRLLTPRKEIVFIVDTLADVQPLLDGALSHAKVYLLDAQGDALQQMAEILAGRGELDAIHLLSHGSSGELQLGATTLNSGNVNEYAGLLTEIGAALAPNGDLLLYGCNVAEGADGIDFVGRIAQVTGANVAASVDDTGSAALGGNWVLEYQTGEIESALPFMEQAIAEYAGVMDGNTLPTLTASGISPTFTEADGLHVQATPVPVFQTANASANDAGQTITGLTFTVTGLLDGAAESFFVDGQKITLGANSTGTTVTNAMTYMVTISVPTVSAPTVSGTTEATVVLSKPTGVDAAAINTLVNTLTYQNTRVDDPTPTPLGVYRVVTLTEIRDNGTANTIKALNIVSRISVCPIDDAPVSIDDDVTTPENVTKVLTLDDFGTYSDAADGSLATPLSLIMITILPHNGSLEYNDAADGNPANWTVVALNQEITSDAITEEKLRFVPDPQENGMAYTTIGFAVKDSSLPSWCSPSSPWSIPYTLTINVTPVNDPPVLTGDLAAPIDEGGSYTIIAADLGYTDADDVAAGVLFTASVMTNGKIQVNGADANTFTGEQLTSGLVTFVHDGSETTTASFKVNVEDGNEDVSTPAESLFTLTVTPKNDAPVLTGDLAAPIAEGGSYVITSTDLGYTDADDVAADVLFTATASAWTNGKIQVNGSDATTFTGVELTSGLVTFVHDGSETTTASFNVNVEDGNEDVSTPVESIFRLTVTPKNDAPMLTGDLLAPIDEGGSYTIIATDLGYTDVDDVAAGVLFTASALTNGKIQVNGADAATFTVEQLTSGLVTFVHDGSETTTASFNVNVEDGNEDVSTPVASLFTLTVTPKNDPPVLTGDLAAPIAEGGSYVITSTDLGYTDADDVAADVLFTATASAWTNGKIQVNGSDATTFTGEQLTSGLVTFVHDGSETTTASFNVNVEDGNEDVSAPFESLFTLTVTPKNDPPVLTGDLAAPIDEGGSYTIIATDLGYTDVDDVAADVLFTATASALTNGKIQVNDADAATFTGEQLASGLVMFVHDGSETTTASFNVNVEDGNEDVSTPVASPFTLTVTPVNDAPVALSDIATTPENTPLVLDVAHGVLSNDSDAEGDTFSVSAINNVAGNVASPVAGTNGGNFTVAADGSYTFDPGTAFDYLRAGASQTTSITYTNTDSLGASANSTLTVTVTGVNDAPVAHNDTASVDENATLTVAAADGVILSGSVPAGVDSDADAGDTLHVTGVITGTALDVAAVGTSIMPTSLTGTYGHLTMAADGSYSYVADTSEALRQGVTVFDTFSYAISDGNGGTSFATLNLTVTGVKDVALAINDVTVLESAGTATFTVTRTGDMDVTASVDYTISDGTAKVAEGDYSASIPTGTLAFAAGESSKTVTVTITDDRTFEQTETFNVTLSNPDNGTVITHAAGVGTIKDDDLLVVTGKDEVSEGSAAIFTVHLNQASASPTDIALTLGATGDTATAPSDYSTTMSAYYYLDVHDYDTKTDLVITDGHLSLPAHVTDFFVSVPTINDNSLSGQPGPYEGAEHFTLTAATSDGQHDSDTATILDDGTGKGYDPQGNVDPAVTPDDDSRLVINNVVVNEGSPYVVFRVEALSGLSFTLSLADGGAGYDGDSSATFNKTSDTAAGKDYGNSSGNLLDEPLIQVYNGTMWEDYVSTNSVSVPEGGSVLLVRVPIHNDLPYERAHAFTLTATRSDNRFSTGLGIIVDDGRGSIFNESGAEVNNAVKDDDRLNIKVDSPIVNEGSDYTIFTITGDAGSDVTLQLETDATVGADPAEDTLLPDRSFTLLDDQNIQYWNGSSWVTNTTATIPTDGKLLVRVAITNEKEVAVENPETFVLRVSSGGSTSDGVATILDDGNGVIYQFDDNGQGGYTGTTDNHDKDGIKPNTEEILATQAASEGIGDSQEGDLNNDGEQDATQNALATLAWRSAEDFADGNNGDSTDSKAIISIGVVDSATATDRQISTVAQLLDIQVKEYAEIDPTTTVVANTDGTTTVTLANGTEVTTPWEPIRFGIEVRTDQSQTTLTDVYPEDSNDPNYIAGFGRADTQVRVLIDVRASRLTNTDANAYIKYVSAGAIDAANNANNPLKDLDGHVITDAGWYDFTQRTAGGDGARLIFEGNKLVEIELIITDNAFGDNDLDLNEIFDPGTLAIVGANPVYRVDRPSADHELSLSTTTPDIEFYGVPATHAEAVALKAWYNPITDDYFYAPDGEPAPYSCYVERPDINVGYVLRATSTNGVFDVHRYLNSAGITQIMGESAAAALHLEAQGYVDKGVLFKSANGTTVDTVLPTLTTFSPADDATNVSVGNDIVLDFSEALVEGSAGTATTVTLRNTTSSVPVLATITVVGDTLVINPVDNLAPNTNYTVTVGADAVSDIAGNDYAVTTTYSFTTGALGADPYAGGSSSDIGAGEVLGGIAALGLLAWLAW